VYTETASNSKQGVEFSSFGEITKGVRSGLGGDVLSRARDDQERRTNVETARRSRGAADARQSGVEWGVPGCMPDSRAIIYYEDRKWVDGANTSIAFRSWNRLDLGGGGPRRYSMAVGDKRRPCGRANVEKS